MSLLRIENLSKSFQGVRAVDQVSFALEQGGIVGLIGPNGAGKSTLFNLLTGFLRPDGGKIIFADREITGFSPYRICRMGMTMTSQLTRPFMNLTALQSTMVGSLLHNPNPAQARRQAYEALEYVGLVEVWHKRVGDLNLSDRKGVELARNLVTQPRVLLLDELMAGLNPQEVEMLLVKLALINRERNITLFIVEHLMKAIMSICQWIVVIDHGEKIAEGAPQEVTHHEKVITAYLGKTQHVAN